ncbi:acyl-CoA reductase [Sphingobacteriaceae bacterium WQ 2009]|uniref:long-chain-fatty-acyl-CoA reductase n=1 Tax=Rhinopithecimicrobium faecis TaxID=2820698 RepID=A0A8T4HFD3_9SPHI|nr:acyl-CoA reductase [Sphingobacteriaceae bacterium WQ 2009]
MTKEQRIQAFEKLGIALSEHNEALATLLQAAPPKNAWYTLENTTRAFQQISETLQAEKLRLWTAPYPSLTSEKVVGLVLAGNIPLVGFHDILSVLIAGFSVQIKVSSDDAGLTSFVLQTLIAIEPAFQEKIHIVDRLAGFDLVIATGSNNSARYFEHYFSKKPHIIRKNRNSAAVLTGAETPEELLALGHDIFDYFGLGCRSVSKIYIPQDYDITILLDGLQGFEGISNHFKYNNNYDYNKSIYLINGDKHYDTGFLLMKEDAAFASPLAVVHYERYADIAELTAHLNDHAAQLQCITTSLPLAINTPTFALGGSQCPALTDYADGVDTLAFLFANV